MMFILFFQGKFIMINYEKTKKLDIQLQVWS